MDTILQITQRRKTVVTLIGGALLGLLLGLAIGWWWWPVGWTNATPGNLRLDFQNDYLVWVAEQYESNSLEWARSRLGVEYWKEGQLDDTLGTLAEALDGQEAARVRMLAQDLGAVPAATPTASEAGDSVVVRLGSVAMVCGVALLVVAFVGGVLFVFNRWRASQAVSEAPRVGVGLRPSEEIAWGAEGPPLAQFVTTYALGDDHYDPSFSIELESGEFMGECGVGVSETIGVGAPNKVTALEVWLFDKNDIRTVTKVLMSDYAFHDEALVAKLAPKGEPVLAEVGKDIVLETKTLRVRARIVEAEYGVGNLPRDSFFARLTLDLGTWVRPGEWGTQSSAGAGASAVRPSL
ncbi:MAG: hypothetical protein PVI59_16620 [Anaerolineae bacterium]|jgi:hypothetical protein